MKRALVLSGGGANGAFQVGALKYIEEKVKTQLPNFRYHIIAGVSVGAINAVMLAMNKFEELHKIWGSDTLERLVFKGRLEVFNVARRLLAQENAVLDNEPLFSLLQRYVKLRDIRTDLYDLRIGAVSLRSGNYVSFRPTDFEEDLEFQKAILASTSIPVLWKPVSEIKTTKGPIFDLVDGGIRDSSPLGNVVHDHPKEIIIINCRSPRLPLDEDPESGKNIFSIARRSLIDIAIDEIFINDLREYLVINDLVSQVKAQDPEMLLYRTSSQTGKRVLLKQFQTILIEPEENLGNIIDFNPIRIREKIEMGYEAARKAFKGYSELSKGKLYSNRK